METELQTDVISKNEDKELDLNKLEKVRTVTSKMRRKTTAKITERVLEGHLGINNVEEIEQNIYDVADSKEEYLSLVVAKIDRMVQTAEVQPVLDANFYLQFYVQLNFFDPWSIRCNKSGKTDTKLYFWVTKPSQNDQSVFTIFQLLADQPSVLLKRKLPNTLSKCYFTSMIDEVELHIFVIFFDQKDKFANVMKRAGGDEQEMSNKAVEYNNIVKVVAFDLENGPNGGFKAKSGERLYQFSLSCDTMAHVFFGSEPNTLVFISHCHTSDATMEQFTMVSFNEDHPYEASIKYTKHISLEQAMFSVHKFVPFNKGRNMLGICVPYSLGRNQFRDQFDAEEQMRQLRKLCTTSKEKSAISIYVLETGSEPHIECTSFRKIEPVALLESALPYISAPGSFLREICYSEKPPKPCVGSKFVLFSKQFKYYLFIHKADYLIAVKHYHVYALGGNTPTNKKLGILLDFKEAKLKLECGLPVVKHCIVSTSLYVALSSTVKTVIVRIEMAAILKDYRKCAKCGKIEKSKRKNIHGKRIAKYKVCRLCKSFNYHLYWRLYPCHYCSLKCLEKDWPNHKKLHIDGMLDRVE